jgi:drug/metabolite transporter (DMT)-like permease
MTTTDSPAYRRSVILMLSSVLLFSINALIIRGLALHAPIVDGWLATLFRGGVGLVVVTLLFGRGRGLEWRNLIGRPLVIARGVFGAVGIVAYYITIVELGAARATVLNLTYPMFAAIIAALWLSEHLGIRAIIWLAVGFGGLMIFLSEEAFRVGVSSYDLLALVGALAAGYVVVVIRQLRHSEHPGTIYASQCIYSVLVALVPAGPAALTLGWTPLVVLSAAGVVVSFGQLFMTQAYREIPVSQGSALQMLMPIVTATGGYLVFGERFTAIELVGAAVTLMATWQIVQRRPTRALLAPGTPAAE